MTFLPIVDRELRIRARWASTYWLRCAAALVASTIAFVMMTAALVVGPNAVGKHMFMAMAWPAWAFCLIDGLRNTADCLSVEKREGTLGLLFLTDLKGYDVALGKFAGAALGSFFTLLSTLPLLALPLLWGGVTAGEFWRMALVLVNTLFLSLAAGLGVSAISRQERRAWLGALALMGFFCGGGPMLEGWLGPVSPASALMFCSPWTMFSHTFDADYTLLPAMFWTSLIVVHLVGWLCLVLAGVLLPRTWQEKERGGGAARRNFLAGTWLANPTRPAAKEIPPSGALSWLAARDDGRRHLVWVPVGGLALAGVVVWVSNERALGMPYVLWVGSLGTHLVLTVWVAWEACHSFGELRRTGMLELVLVTPVRVREIIIGQDRAMRRLFQGPIICLVGTELILLGDFYVRTFVGIYGTEVVASIVLGTVLAGVSIGTFVLDLLAATRVGMWLSLSARRPAQAWGRTVLWVVVLPWLAMGPATLLCCGVATPLILAAKSIVFCSWASGKLLNNFRQAAAQQYVPSTEKLRWWK